MSGSTTPPRRCSRRPSLFLFLEAQSIPCEQVRHGAWDCDCGRRRSRTKWWKWGRVPTEFRPRGLARQRVSTSREKRRPAKLTRVKRAINCGTGKGCQIKFSPWSRRRLGTVRQGPLLQPVSAVQITKSGGTWGCRSCPTVSCSRYSFPSCMLALNSRGVLSCRYLKTKRAQRKECIGCASPTASTEYSSLLELIKNTPRLFTLLAMPHCSSGVKPHTLTTMPSCSA